jgi:Na+-transporting NADH:ubiquinone oxidoreductase subunit NqrD
VKIYGKTKRMGEQRFLALWNACALSPVQLCTICDRFRVIFERNVHAVHIVLIDERLDAYLYNFSMFFTIFFHIFS